MSSISEPLLQTIEPDEVEQPRAPANVPTTPRPPAGVRAPGQQMATNPGDAESGEAS